MSEYYFRKWQQVLSELEKHIELDLEYQDAKAHDQTSCDAAQRLCSVLGKYMAVYNDSLDCLQQNVQVQKIEYMQDVVNAVAARILELKHQLRKLEAHYHQFFGNGLVQHLLTFDDADPKNLPYKIIRSEHMQAMIEEVMSRAQDKINLLQNEIREEDKAPIKKNIDLSLWESDEEDDEDEKDKIEKEVKLSKESIKRIEMLKLIQAHERSRQVIRRKTRSQFKREMWEKQLKGSLKPQANFETKEKASNLIKKVCRAYFEIKRNRIKQCKVDEKLNINYCFKSNSMEKAKYEQLKEQRHENLKRYKKDWMLNYKEFEHKFMKNFEYEIHEDYRGLIRDWFRKWYEEVKFFYDIPKEEQGGSSLIIEENVPSPSEWRTQYETYLNEKTANKNKTVQQKKWEKMEAKREESRLKKEELKKIKQEQALLKKMMKNPSMHPGFKYPVSKKTKQILNAIENYRKDWKDLDVWETKDVIVGFVTEINKGNAYMYCKKEILKAVDEDMRHELKILKQALVIDYKRNNEEMPENIKAKVKKPKQKRRLKSAISESVQDKMEDLAVAGVMKQTADTKFEDFKGDFNFAADDLRCDLRVAQPLGGDLRFLWWEKCIELIHGSKRILLIGPKGSGKSMLVDILASVNGAMLFELNPTNVSSDLPSADYLKQVVNSVATCAKAVQPSVIHLKRLHLLFCKKAPQGVCKKNLTMYAKFFVQHLMKKIHKNDLITIIGSCEEPWLTKTTKLLKKFPEAILMPNTTYSTVSLILRNWMNGNRAVPRNLNLQSIAQLLQGYSFGHIKESLNSFLTADTIIRIAAYGLSPKDVVDHVTSCGSEDSVDYKKYQQWYNENTAWGKKEAKRLEEDKEFKQLVKKFAEKEKSKGKVKREEVDNTDELL